MADGKAFEERFRRSAEEAGLTACRQTDACGYNPRSGRMWKKESEVDFHLFSSRGHAYMVECKATGARYLRRDALKDHQRRRLVEFEGLHPRFHGLVAVEFVGGTARQRRMFLVGVGRLLAIGGPWSPENLAEAGDEFPRLSTYYALDMGRWEGSDGGC